MHSLSSNCVVPVTLHDRHTPRRVVGDSIIRCWVGYVYTKPIHIPGSSGGGPTDRRNIGGVSIVLPGKRFLGGKNPSEVALGLSLDAFAVAIMASVTLPKITRRHLFRLAFHFSLFQAMMPVIGWATARNLESTIRDWDHWIAFGILLLVGAHAIKNAFGTRSHEASPDDPTRGLTLVALSFATSIDALAVGLTFALLGVKIIVPAVVIGVVAGTMTVTGMLLGKRLGRALGRKAELLGGFVLIAIGVKILIEHLSD